MKRLPCTLHKYVTAYIYISWYFIMQVFYLGKKFESRNMCHTPLDYHYSLYHAWSYHQGQGHSHHSNHAEDLQNSSPSTDSKERGYKHTWLYKYNYGLCQVNRCRRACAKCTYSDSSWECAKSHVGISSPLIHSIMSNDSVNKQRRTSSDCVDTQPDLGLPCPHMPKHWFTHGMAHICV